MLRSSWDIPFQLNRKYGLTAMSSDLVFPMEIKPPSDGELYSTPAQTFFDDQQFPDTTLYMQLNFQPNLTLDEFYFLTIRDPDGVLRFSISMYKKSNWVTKPIIIIKRGIKNNCNIVWDEGTRDNPEQSFIATSTYRIQMRYNPLDSTEGEQTIEFPYAQSQSYWRLGIWIRENSFPIVSNSISENFREMRH
ncbi:unnamed protein product [Rodentolepis nana]|uniref:Outer capsid protein VP4 n=1 Tax=Rodentolepis nana TaxID=102285 RepID=A0A0R3TKG1_RODNA|nr:unnamed protein product [Rodentolepis nana]